MAEIRTSQRVPLRCMECAQRRIKCDKKIPCGRCIANHRAHLCVREVVRVRGKPTVATPMEDANASLVRQNSRLQERVAELELALTLSLRDRAGARPFRVGNGSPSMDRPTPTAGHRATTFEEVGAILDEWNLGLLKQEDSGNPRSEKDLHFLVDTLRSVPDKSTSTRIVEFSLQILGWIHCALRADQFLTEHEAFQNALMAGTLEVLQDHKWMAIYFSVLAVGIFFMSDEDTSSLNLPLVEPSPYPFLVSYHWYCAAFLQLEYSDAMGIPQLHVVQVAAILTLCHSHFGQRYRDINLSSLAHNTARALQMHRLGSESSYPKSLERIPEWADETGRELGRRLWWTLVICDWSSVSRLYSADSFDCILSVGRFDYNVILGGTPLSDGVVVFSPLLHHIELANLSQVLHEYIQTSNESSAALCEFFSKLDELEQGFVSKADRLSASFSAGVNLGQQTPVWLAGQRSHYLCTINFIRLILCRVLLQQSVSQLPAWAEIRASGMRAAMAIVYLHNVPPTYQLLWVFGSSTIAAGVFLCLDLLTSSQERTETQIQEQRAAVEVCIVALQKYSYKTTICKEGSKTLRRLLDLEMAQHDRPVDPEGLTRLIKSMARLSEQGSQEPTVNDPGHSSWPPLMVEQTSGLMGAEVPSLRTLASSPVPGMVSGYDQPDLYWLMDSIVFPEY
ncbi:hypothetical protein CNMCM7691_006026 [Aspergillus felis]|uniref:Zn(2)-C6 fungal-type domain-containing protein n=1 Tax=Aspergillus felis TaxID=1287682 RepID=A0A8H6V8E3_9EURO|nr:hypothetical protein CNMCM7691_006026 [Aspergillus felis]